MKRSAFEFESKEFVPKPKSVSWKDTPPVSIDSPVTVNLPAMFVSPATPTPPPTTKEPVVELSLTVVPLITIFPLEDVPVVVILLAPVSIDPNPETMEPPLRAPTPVNEDDTILEPNSVVVNNDVPLNVSVLPEANSRPVFLNVAIVFPPPLMVVLLSLASRVIPKPLSSVAITKLPVLFTTYELEPPW